MDTSSRSEGTTQIRQQEVVAELGRRALETGDIGQLMHDAAVAVAERDGTKWMLSIRDEGIGIDPDDADRIFEVFQRLHAQEEHTGTGIGLALCRRIVERHGSNIWITSEPGEGTTLSFTLPAAGDSDE